MMRYILSILALAAVTFGQVTPTHIGKHQIDETVPDWYERELDLKRQTKQTSQTDIASHQVGETFAEWLRLNQIDLNDICQSHKRNDKRMDFKAVCKKLSTIRDTGYGDFYTTDQTRPPVGWRFVDGKVGDYSIDGKWQ